LIGLPFLVLVVDGFLFLVAAAIPAMVLVDACAHLPLPYHVFFFHVFTAKTCELYTIIPKDGIIM
jgi:hypothetical protein